MIAETDYIFRALESYELNRASMVSKEQMGRILNELLGRYGVGRTTLTEIPADILTELWEKTSGNQNDEVILADYVLTIQKAQDMLLQKIQETEGNAS